jgi:hypothetical protein
MVVDPYAEIIGTNYDLVTIAYATNGLPMWTNRYNGTGGRELNEFPRSVASGPDGEIVVACSSDGKAYNNFLDDEIFSFAVLRFGSLSTPMILPPESLPENQWRIGFEGSPGREYTIERSLNSTGPWLPLGTTNTGPNGFGALIDSNPFLNSGFYRGRFQ